MSYFSAAELLDEAYKISTGGNGSKEVRYFRTALDLVRFCGCKIELISIQSADMKTVSGRTHVISQEFNDEAFGFAPNSCVQLGKSGTIYVFAPAGTEEYCLQLNIGYVCHEALHYLVGSESVDDEGIMMGLEWAAYCSIENENQRLILLNFFSESDDGYGTIGFRLRDLYERYFEDKKWESLIGEGIKRNFLLRAPNQGQAILNPNLLENLLA